MVTLDSGCADGYVILSNFIVLTRKGCRAPLCSAFHWSEFTLVVFLLNVLEPITMEFYLKKENLLLLSFQCKWGYRTLGQSALNHWDGSFACFWRNQATGSFFQGQGGDFNLVLFEPRKIILELSRSRGLAK